MSIALLLGFILFPLEIQAENADLGRAIDAILSKKKVRESGVGIHILNRASGETLYSRNRALPLNPASTVKILTSAAALEKLGPNHRFKTRVKTHGDDVCLIGGGDPLMVHENLWLLVEEARRRGLKNISGKLILDDSLFPTSTQHAGSFKGDRKRAFTAPISALSLNFNSLTVHGYPTKVGSLARVGVEPDSRFFKISNRARTSKKSRRKDLQAELQKTNQGYDVQVFGKVGSNHDRASIYRAFPEPWAYVAYLFVDYFTKQGGAWSGKMVHETCPNEAEPLLSFESPPLSEAIRRLGKFSNNFIAEMTLRALAENETDKNGLTVLESWVKEKGLTKSKIRLTNASGLSRKTRVPAELLTGILYQSLQNPRIWPDLYASLPISGEDGTLKRVKIGSKGAFRAKTGRISGVSAISGIGQSPRYGEIIFAILLNDVPKFHWKLLQVQEELLKILFSN